MIGPLDDIMSVGRVSMALSQDKLIDKLNSLRDENQASALIAAWATVFASLGYPTLRLPSKTIAALAFTDPTDATFESPWPAFLIRIDSSVFGEVVDIAVLVARETITVSSTIAGEILTTFSKSWVDAADIEGVVFEGHHDPTEADVPNDVAKRRNNIAIRIAAGAIQLVLNAPPQRAKLTPGQLLARKIDAKKGKPLLTEYVVGKDVTIDLREHIREYASGKARVMRVIRWLVRGHWRNQVAGKGRAERRRTWIKPYWKGDQEAATLVRGYSVKGEDDESANRTDRGH